MKGDIDGIRQSAKILKNGKISLEDSFNEIQRVIQQLKEIIKNMTEEEAETHKENYRYVKEELKNIRKRINQGYIEEAQSIKKWINNKADKLEKSENLNQNILYTDTTTLSTLTITGIQATSPQPISFGNKKLDNIYEEIMKSIGAGTYFTSAQVETALSKIVICSSDEEFEKMYNKSGLKDDINRLESFTYKGKIYIRPNAGDNVLKYEINRDIAAQKRSKGKTSSGSSTETTPSQSFNRAMAEYITRLNSGLLVVDEETGELKNLDTPEFDERQEKYDDSVNMIMKLQKGLELLGFGNLILKTCYGTKTKLMSKLKELTGSDTFYNDMINAMNIISDKKNATDEEIADAREQLQDLGNKIQDISTKISEKLKNIGEGIMNGVGAGTYFTSEQVETALSKIVICPTDDYFMAMYSDSKLQDDISRLESFTYNGKIYVRPNASDSVLKYEVNRDIAAQVRSKGKTSSGGSTVTTASQSFNRAMAEYITRLNSGLLVVDKKGELTNSDTPEFDERQEKYDDSVNMIMKLQKGLESLGFGDLILKTCYGDKAELVSKLKEITGSNTFYNDMITAMNTISDKKNATPKEIKAAKEQLQDLGNKIQNIDKRVLDGKDVYLEKGDRVYFLDTCFEGTTKKGNPVEKGSDCFILESVDEDGNTIYGMIDTGDESTSERVLKYLDELNIKELDFVLITHGHTDHTGGYKAICNSGVHVKNLYVKDEENTTKVEKMIEFTEKQNDKKLSDEEKTDIHYVNDKYEDNTVIQFGNFTIPLFNTEDRLAGTTQKDNENENVNTIGALAVVNGQTIHFAGDIGKYEGIDAGVEESIEVKKYMQEHGLGDSVTVNKTAHHANGINEEKNSVNNSDAELANLNPKNAIVTMAEGRATKVQKFSETIDKIEDYIEDNEGKLFFSDNGTTVMNVTSDGKYTLQQLADHWETNGKEMS